MLTAGSSIAGFEIVGLLGRGGMGEVYEAQQASLGRPVALKVVRLSEDDGGEFRERFRREGHVQATLHHPHIVPVFEAGEFEDGLFLAMLLVRGPTLKQLIRVGAIAPDRAIALLRPIAAALDAAHEVGLVHRDVKPQNILVGQRDHPYLADFGLTRTGADTSLTRTGQFMGTLDYVAPEAIRGQTVGAPADIYSFACVVHEALTGDRPFERESQAALINAHLHDAPESVQSVGLPAAVDGALGAGMAKDPAGRPATATALITRVEHALAGGDYTAAATQAETAEEPIVVTLRSASTTNPTIPGVPPATASQPFAVSAEVATTVAHTTRRWSPLAIAAGVATAGLAVTAFLVARGGASPASPMSASAASSAVGLRAPASWEPISTDEAPSIPGLALTDAVAVSPAARTGAGAQAGFTDASGTTLLPKTLRDAVRGALPAPTRVLLGENTALRYAPVELTGFDRPLALYVVPTTKGVATLACAYTAAGSPQDPVTCDRIASTLRLTDAKPRSLDPDDAVVRRLNGALSDFARRRAAPMAALRAAKTPDGQQSSARTLARAYEASAKRIAALDPGPVVAGRVDDIADAIDSGAGGYERLAASTGAGNAELYRAARKRIQDAEQARTDAIKALRTAGYRIR